MNHEGGTCHQGHVALLIFLRHVPQVVAGNFRVRRLVLELLVDTDQRLCDVYRRVLLSWATWRSSCQLGRVLGARQPVVSQVEALRAATQEAPVGVVAPKLAGSCVAFVHVHTGSAVF